MINLFFMRTAGVDEAGKGPVIGPMVVCCVSCKNKDLKKLKEIGVKDSKKLKPKRREELSKKIFEICDVEYEILEAEEINKLMKEQTINEILYKTYSKLIKKVKPDLAYVDSSDVIPERLSKRLSEETGVKVIAKHKADSKYLEVSAASIVAKVIRDRRIEEIKGEIGFNFGSGYASDVRTVEFLKNYFKENGKFPKHVRLFWKTTDKIVKEVSQRKIFEF